MTALCSCVMSTTTKKLVALTLEITVPASGCILISSCQQGSKDGSSDGMQLWRRVQKDSMTTLDRPIRQSPTCDSFVDCVPPAWVVVWQLLDRRDYLLDASAPAASGEAEQRQPHRPVPAVAATAHLPIFHGTRVTHVTPPTIPAYW